MHHGKHHHAKHHHTPHQPVTGDGLRHRVFLALLSSAIFLIFIVLPFWLLYKTLSEPAVPGSESFSPPSASTATAPAPAPEPPEPDDDEPIRFK